MDLVLILEFHFVRGPDGTVCTGSAYDSSYWTKYLEVFDRVEVVARVDESGRIPDSPRRSDGPRVAFRALPDYRGPLQFAIRRGRIREICREAILGPRAVLLRVPSPIAGTVGPLLLNERRPYGVEVAGDPAASLGPGANAHLLRPLFQRALSSQMKAQVAGAAACSYVTESALQERYPSKAVTAWLPNLDLPGSALAGGARTFAAPRVLLTVGSLEQPYKGVDVLLDAVAQGGRDVELRIAGDGRTRAALESQSRRLGLEARVSFLGTLPGPAAVAREMDRADLFVLASRTEGSPRVMIEAMARGLPCVGTSVGGIPELLDGPELVPAGDARSLALKIADLLGDRPRMERLSARNLARAAAFTGEALRPRRTAFYRHLKEITEAWIRDGARP